MRINVKLVFLSMQLLRQKLNRLLILLFFLLLPIDITFADTNDFLKLKELSENYYSSPTSALEGSISSLISSINTKLLSHALDCSQWTLDDGRVNSVVTRIAGKYPEARAIVISLYEQRLLSLISNNDSTKIDLYYSIILRFRPDPNQGNNKLREQIVIQARGVNTKLFALGRLEEIKAQKKYNFLFKVKLYFAGFYGRGVLYVPLLLIIVIILILGSKFLLSRQKTTNIKKNAPRKSVEKALAGGGSYHNLEIPRSKPAAKKPERPERQERVVKEEVFDRGYERTNQKDDEYTRLLAFFELTDQATEQEIKKAYRDRIKSLHPDKMLGSADANPEKFAEVKETYNRIMEIRSSWFGGRK